MNGLIEQFGVMRLEETKPVFQVVDTKRMGWIEKRGAKKECERGASVFKQVTVIAENFFFRRSEILGVVAQLTAIDDDLALIKKTLKKLRGQIPLSQTIAPIWVQARLTYYLARQKIKYVLSIGLEKNYKALQEWRSARVADCQNASHETVSRLWQQVDEEILTQIKMYASYESIAFRKSITLMHMEVGGFMLQAASELKNDTLASKIIARMREIVMPEAQATMSSQSDMNQPVGSIRGAPAFNPFWFGRLYTWALYSEADTISRQIQAIAAQNVQLKADVDLYRETLCKQGISVDASDESKQACAAFKDRLNSLREAFSKENSNLYAGARNALVVEAANYAAGVSEAIHDTRQHLELLEDLLSDQARPLLYVLHAFYQFDSEVKSSEYEKIQKLFVLATLLETTRCSSSKHKIDKFIKSTMNSIREVVSVKGRACVKFSDQEKKIYNDILLEAELDSPKEGFPELCRSLMLKLLFEQKYFSTGKTPWELRALLYVLQTNDQYQIAWELSKTNHPDFINMVAPYMSKEPELQGIASLFTSIAKAEVERDPFSYAAAWKLLCNYAEIDMEHAFLLIAYNKLIEVQKMHDYIAIEPKISFEDRTGGIIPHALSDFDQGSLTDLKDGERVGLLSRALASSLCGDVHASKLVTLILEDARSREFFDRKGDNLQMVFENTCNKIKSQAFKLTVPTDDGFNEIGPNEWSLFIHGPLKPYLRGKTTFSMKEIGFQKALYSLVKYEERSSSKKITEALTQSLGKEDFASWCEDMGTL